MKFWERMEKVFNQGIEVSKDVIEKARDKAKEMGEKGILKFEIMQLEKDAEKLFVKLGTKVYELYIVNKSIKLPGDSSEVMDLFKEIYSIQEKIDDKEETLKNL